MSDITNFTPTGGGANVLRKAYTEALNNFAKGLDTNAKEALSKSSFPDLLSAVNAGNMDRWVAAVGKVEFVLNELKASEALDTFQNQLKPAATELTKANNPLRYANEHLAKLGQPAIQEEKPQAEMAQKYNWIQKIFAKNSGQEVADGTNVQAPAINISGGQNSNGIMA